MELNKVVSKNSNRDIRLSAFQDKGINSQVSFEEDAKGYHAKRSICELYGKWMNLLSNKGVVHGEIDAYVYKVGREHKYKVKEYYGKGPKWIEGKIKKVYYNNKYKLAKVILHSPKKSGKKLMGKAMDQVRYDIEFASDKNDSKNGMPPVVDIKDDDLKNGILHKNIRRAKSSIKHSEVKTLCYVVSSNDMEIREEEATMIERKVEEIGHEFQVGESVLVNCGIKTFKMGAAMDEEKAYNSLEEVIKIVIEDKKSLTKELAKDTESKTESIKRNENKPSNLSHKIKMGFQLRQKKKIGNENKGAGPIQIFPNFPDDPAWQYYKGLGITEGMVLVCVQGKPVVSKPLEEVLKMLTEYPVEFTFFHSCKLSPGDKTIRYNKHIMKMVMEWNNVSIKDIADIYTQFYADSWLKPEINLKAIKLIKIDASGLGKGAAKLAEKATKKAAKKVKEHTKTHPRGKKSQSAEMEKKNQSTEMEELDLLIKMLNKLSDVKLMKRKEWSLLATHNFIVFIKLMAAQQNSEIRDYLTKNEGVSLDPRLFESDENRKKNPLKCPLCNGPAHIKETNSCKHVSPPMKSWVDNITELENLLLDNGNRREIFKHHHNKCFFQFDDSCDTSNIEVKCFARLQLINAKYNSKIIGGLGHLNLNSKITKIATSIAYKFETGNDKEYNHIEDELYGFLDTSEEDMEDCESELKIVLDDDRNFIDKITLKSTKSNAIILLQQAPGEAEKIWEKYNQKSRQFLYVKQVCYLLQSNHSALQNIRKFYLHLESLNISKLEEDEIEEIVKLLETCNNGDKIEFDPSVFLPDNGMQSISAENLYQIYMSKHKRLPRELEISIDYLEKEINAKFIGKLIMEKLITENNMIKKILDKNSETRFNPRSTKNFWVILEIMLCNITSEVHLKHLKDLLKVDLLQGAFEEKDFLKFSEGNASTKVIKKNLQHFKNIVTKVTMLQHGARQTVPWIRWNTFTSNNLEILFKVFPYKELFLIFGRKEAASNFDKVIRLNYDLEYINKQVVSPNVESKNIFNVIKHKMNERDSETKENYSMEVFDLNISTKPKISLYLIKEMLKFEYKPMIRFLNENENKILDLTADTTKYVPDNNVNIASKIVEIINCCKRGRIVYVVNTIKIPWNKIDGDLRCIYKILNGLNKINFEPKSVGSQRLYAKLSEELKNANKLETATIVSDILRLQIHNDIIFDNIEENKESSELFSNADIPPIFRLMLANSKHKRTQKPVEINTKAMVDPRIADKIEHVQDSVRIKFKGDMDIVNVTRLIEMEHFKNAAIAYNTDGVECSPKCEVGRGKYVEFNFRTHVTKYIKKIKDYHGENFIESDDFFRALKKDAQPLSLQVADIGYLGDRSEMNSMHYRLLCIFLEVDHPNCIPKTLNLSAILEKNIELDCFSDQRKNYMLLQELHHKRFGDSEDNINVEEIKDLISLLRSDENNNHIQDIGLHEFPPVIYMKFLNEALFQKEPLNHNIVKSLQPQSFIDKLNENQKGFMNVCGNGIKNSFWDKQNNPFWKKFQNHHIWHIAEQTVEFAQGKTLDFKKFGKELSTEDFQHATQFFAKLNSEECKNKKCSLKFDMSDIEIKTDVELSKVIDFLKQNKKDLEKNAAVSKLSIDGTNIPKAKENTDDLKMKTEPEVVKTADSTETENLKNGEGEKKPKMKQNDPRATLDLSKMDLSSDKTRRK
eukprot:g3342.t1